MREKFFEILTEIYGAGVSKWLEDRVKKKMRNRLRAEEKSSQKKELCGLEPKICQKRDEKYSGKFLMENLYRFHLSTIYSY